jgi:Arc/MetJ-type ribon-helix-helix transcriptional regulator
MRAGPSSRPDHAAISRPRGIAFRSSTPIPSRPAVVCHTERDTIPNMASAISVRLDPEAMRALAQLEATGISRSEAIRRALLDSASRLRQRSALAAEAASLEADEDDRREMLEVAAFMESMRAPG